MSGESGKNRSDRTFFYSKLKIRFHKMFSLMPEVENDKHAHRRHHNKRHGNRRMKEPVSMEMRAAARGAGGSGCPLWCFGFAHCKMSPMRN